MGNCCGSPNTSKRGGADFSDVHYKHNDGNNGVKNAGKQGYNTRYEPDPTNGSVRSNSGTTTNTPQHQIMQHSFPVGELCSFLPHVISTEMFGIMTCVLLYPSSSCFIFLIEDWLDQCFPGFAPLSCHATSSSFPSSHLCYLYSGLFKQLTSIY